MFKRIKQSVADRIAPTGKHLTDLRSELRSRLHQFNESRSSEEQQALSEDFSQVLHAWGIDDAGKIPAVVRSLRLRFLIFGLPVVVCAVAAALLQSTVSCLGFVLVATPCIFGIITTAWRISVLENGRFLPLSRWLLSFWGVFRP
ncbi:MAG: hypothetical protein DELT_02568 [Desulfovibrio sp.]